jgi:hypothetical protein
MTDIKINEDTSLTQTEHFEEIPTFSNENPLDAKFRDDISYIALIKFSQLGVTRDDLFTFQNNVKTVYYPWNKGYNSLRFDVNRRFNIFPLIILMAETLDDVKNGFAFAIKHKIELSIRSGAHNNEGYSLCSGIVIDQSRRTNVKINIHDIKKRKKNVKVEIEAGAVIGHVVKELSKYDLAISSGTCPNVGVSGLTLGGGFGFLMRKYGITSDNLVELNMILADGTYITANEHNYSDLFWANRGGGGGNFGIVTSFTFYAHHMCDVTIFELDYDIEHLVPIVSLWQKWAPNTTDKLTAELDIASENSLMVKKMCEKNRIMFKPLDKTTISVVGLYLGPKCKLKKHLKPWFDLRIKPTNTVIETVKYIKAADYFAGKPHRLPFFKNKSSFVDNPLSPEDIEVIGSIFKTAPPDSRLELQAFGGAVNNVKASHTAFPYRNSLYWCGFSTLWYDEMDANRHIDWVRKLWDKFQPFSNHHCYVNFSDSDIGEHYMEYYYHNNKDKLIKIKKKYDPTYVFNFPQVIR